MKEQHLLEPLMVGAWNQAINCGERDQQKIANLIMSSGEEEERKMECHTIKEPWGEKCNYMEIAQPLSRNVRGCLSENMMDYNYGEVKADLSVIYPRLSDGA